MREHWREFARDDPMHYIAANRSDWDADAFYEMGRDLTADLVEWAGPGSGRERMLEIGCGAGRMLVHFAEYFEHVEGVDIAEEMLAAARAGNLPANVNLTLTGGADLSAFADASVDFVLSVQVFQHVPDRSVIAAYIAETGRILRPGGRSVLHFDSRPNPPLRRLALLLPDRLLPRDNRRYIRRYPVPAVWPAAVGAAAGLHVVDERSVATTDHMILFERR